MCGRTACTLEPQIIRNACTLYSKNHSEFIRPRWNENSQKYHPSPNIAPTACTPILFSSSNLEGTDLQLEPMLWGIIPPWHKSSDYTKHGLSTNNCRLEGIMDSKLYRPLLVKGQRCVVLCQGFYEWCTGSDKKNKQPYFIYSAKNKESEIHASDVWENFNETYIEENGWNGPRLLMMAGIFDTWSSSEYSGLIKNYSIITQGSHSNMSWLHHRMPAILDTDQLVLDWLNNDLSHTDALKLLKAENQLDLAFYPVTKEVGKSQYKNADSLLPIDLTKKKEVASSKFMTNWLLKGKNNYNETPPGKKMKLS